MTLTELRALTRFLTNTNSTTYSDADTLVNLNTAYDTFTDEILSCMDDWDFQGEIATTNLVANQQEYVLPTDIIKIKRVEITYDGTNWYTSTPMDINEKSDDTSTSSVANDFSTAEPYHDLMDNSLFMYPIPSANITGGLKVWYEKLPSQLTIATDSPNLLRQFQKGLAYAAAEDYFDKYGKDKDAARMQIKKEQLLQKLRETYRKRNQDRPYVVTPAFVDYDYGND